MKYFLKKKLKKIFKWGLDMNKKDVYIYYSAATDITGKKLQAALGIQGGNKKPEGKKLVIGWGAKTKDVTKFPKSVKVINHPNAIMTNRDKFEAMGVMATALNVEGSTHIPKYVTTDKVKQEIFDGNISLPLIGRKKFHQGGKGFWSCPTMAQLEDAITAGAHHFIHMLPIKEEYRLHVFDGVVIHAVKKVKRSDKEFEKAFIDDELARQKILVEKNNDQFDEATAMLMLNRQAKNATEGGANMLLRSNRLGWKFAIVKKHPKGLADVAIKAVKALGLDFGAVDCCLDNINVPYIFEVNSGPGLEATSFDKYVEAFKLAIDNKKTSTTVTAPFSEKNTMKKQLAELQEMVDKSEDSDELAKVREIGAKLIFGGQ
jgi:hypothetical protein